MKMMVGECHQCLEGRQSIHTSFHVQQLPAEMGISLASDIWRGARFMHMLQLPTSNFGNGGDRFLDHILMVDKSWVHHLFWNLRGEVMSNSHFSQAQFSTHITL
jgi:hypothetical protein